MTSEPSVFVSHRSPSPVEREPSVGQVDFVTIRARLAREPIVQDVVLRRARLQQVPDLGVVRVVVLEDELSNVVDVEVMGESVTETIVRELGALDEDGAVRRISGQDPILIVVEEAIADRQVRPLLTNPSAVLIHDGRAG